MKKVLFTIFVLGGLLTGCSDSEDISQGQEIKLTASVAPSTRGTVIGEQSVLIVAGQQVGVTITGANAEHNNAAWTVLSGGELENTGDPIYYNGGKTLSIKAYQPYNAAWTDIANSTYDFSVAADQSDKSDDGYANSDLMIADALVQASNTAINLNFQHLMACVIVKLYSNLGENVEISILNTIRKAKVKHRTVTVVATETPSSILAGVGNAVTAVIVPQTVAAGKAFIQLAVTNSEGNKSYYIYSLPEDYTFNGGSVYTFNLGKDNLLPDYYYEEF